MADTKNGGSERLPVTLDWSVADDVPIQPANVFLVQGSSVEVVLTLGLAAPPVQVARLSAEEITRYLAQNAVAVQHPVRIVLPPSAAGSLGKALRAYVAADNRDGGDDEETQ